MKQMKQLGLLLITIYSAMLISPVSIASDNHPESRVTSSTVAPININLASADELANRLNGIGLAKAQRIVDYREKFGPFVAIEQLKEVSGIGQAILDKNNGRLSLE